MIRVIFITMMAAVAYISAYTFFADYRKNDLTSLITEVPFVGNVMQQVAESVQPIFPAAEESQETLFSWEYQGEKYSLSETLYASYYRYYASLPIGITDDGSLSKSAKSERGNAMFMKSADGDDTIKQLAESLRVLGQQHALTDDHIAELVVAFVQAIPYDQQKIDRRDAGQDGATEKIYYPYETLYLKTGVCQDKSYLAYMLLQELGYGVALFVFPEENHMAVGIQCPAAYANYSSKYCFVETTSVGNRIGLIPELSSGSRIASSDHEIELSGENEYSELGKPDIENISAGKDYTAIADTIAMQKEIGDLKAAIVSSQATLKKAKASIDSNQQSVDDMLKKLKKLSSTGKYEEYNDLVKEYNDAVSSLTSEIHSYNAKVKASNALVTKYNHLIKEFYR
jgi:hypothetical protein